MFSIQACVVLAAIKTKTDLIVHNFVSRLPETVKQSLVYSADSADGEPVQRETLLESFSTVLKETAVRIYTTETYTSAECYDLKRFYSHFISIAYEIIGLTSYSRPAFYIPGEDLDFISTVVMTEFKVWLTQVLMDDETHYGWLDLGGQDLFMEYKFNCLSEFLDLVNSELFASRYEKRRERILSKLTLKIWPANTESL